MRKGKEAEEMKIGEKVERKELLDKRETLQQDLIIMENLSTNTQDNLSTTK